MEEGSFCLIGTAYSGSGAPMDKSRIPRDLFGIFWISLSIVISGLVLKRYFFVLIKRVYSCIVRDSLLIFFIICI